MKLARFEPGSPFSKNFWLDDRDLNGFSSKKDILAGKAASDYFCCGAMLKILFAGLNLEKALVGPTDSKEEDARGISSVSEQEDSIESPHVKLIIELLLDPCRL